MPRGPPGGRGDRSLPRVVAPLDGAHLAEIGSREARLERLELGHTHRGVAQPLADADVRRLVVLPVREAVAASEVAELLLKRVELSARPRSEERRVGKEWRPRGAEGLGMNDEEHAPGRPDARGLR